jgi:hypothetical protein
MKTRATILGFVVVLGLSIALPTSLQALSVGQIVVRSFRGMPFLAEVPLLLDAQEQTGGVTVVFGDEKEYRAEGLTRAAVIDHLGVKVTPGAHDVVSISSRKPLQESAFDLLLLVRAGHITIVRTYHVVLPPAPSPPALPVAKAPVEAPSLLPASDSALPPSAQPKKELATPPIPAWVQQLPKRYGPVAQGATMYGVVEEMGVPKDLLWQAIVLVWQANKPEFSGGNLHGLRAGISLTLPSEFADNLATLGRTEAQRIIAEEWEKWQALRQAASGQQPMVLSREEAAGPPRKVAESPDQEPTASEKALALTEQPAAPAESFSTASDKALTAGADISAVPRGKVTSSPAVVLSGRKPARAAETAELRSVLQGIEELLARRLPQAGGASDVTSFVSTAELQTALQGLEERLVQRLHESIEQVSVQPKPSPRVNSASLQIDGSPFLTQWLPTDSMVYVLAVENALLLLLVIGIVWRWYRRRA